MTLIQTEPKSIKIGTTAIKRVTIRPNGTEKQIRPAGWQPGANTLAYYPFNGDANDHKGSGTLYNLSTNGVSYNERLLNGNYVGTFTGTYSYNGNKGGEYTGGISSKQYPKTYSGWVKTTGNGGGNRWMLFLFQTANRNYGFGVKTAHNNGYIEFCFSGSKSVNTPDNLGLYTDGQRHHFVGTTDSNSINLYIDGVLANTASGTIPADTQNYNIYIGKDTTSYNYYGFAGQLSEVILEDKTWSAQEISDYYNLTKGNYGL